MVYFREWHYASAAVLDGLAPSPNEHANQLVGDFQRAGLRRLVGSCEEGFASQVAVGDSLRSICSCFEGDLLATCRKDWGPGRKSWVRDQELGWAPRKAALY